MINKVFFIAFHELKIKLEIFANFHYLLTQINSATPLKIISKFCYDTLVQVVTFALVRPSIEQFNEQRKTMQKT